MTLTEVRKLKRTPIGVGDGRGMGNNPEAISLAYIKGSINASSIPLWISVSSIIIKTGQQEVKVLFRNNGYKVNYISIKNGYKNKLKVIINRT